MPAKRVPNRYHNVTPYLVVEGASRVTMPHVYVSDVDQTYQRALQAGASSIREPADQFDGDRRGGVRDVAGNQWWIATHIEDVSPEEIRRRSEA